MVMHSMFMILCIYGWFNWNKHKQGNEVKIIKLTSLQLYIHLFLALCAWIVSSTLLEVYSDNEFPKTDSFVCIVSLMANFYLSKRIFENWYFWIISDAVFVWIFLSNEMYPSAFLYCTFLLLATYGLFSWKKDLKTE